MPRLIRTRHATCLAIALAGLVGCDINELMTPIGAPRPTPTASSVPTTTSTVADPLPLLREFVAPGADYLALTKRLRPTSADLYTLFSPELAIVLEREYAALWDANKPLIIPNKGQTEVRLSATATTDELISWTGAARSFPGGYQRLGSNLKPGFTMHCFAFVVPGNDTGLVFNGLVYVNNHWVICPKPWRSLPESGAPSPPPIAYDAPTTSPVVTPLPPTYTPPAYGPTPGYVPPRDPFEHHRQMRADAERRMEAHRREAQQRFEEMRRRSP